MRVEEFKEIYNKSLRIVQVGIKKGYFKEDDEKILMSKLKEVLEKGIVTNIAGTAIYGMYDPKSKMLCFNVKVFKDEKEALIYILHEMKHALDDNELSIGFDLKSEENGEGMNEGATQRFATDIAEEILGEKIPETMQSSLGITLSTNLDEYQIEDKMNELFCKALGISRAEFLRMQNENDLSSLNTLKQKFNEFADFDAFEKALDGIYAIQEETWVDENGKLLDQEAEPTPEQTARAKELIRQCQSQILQFVEKSKPEKLEDIKGEMIMIDGEIMSGKEMLYQEDYKKYQDFIMQGYDFGEKSIVYISGTEDYQFSDEWGITGRLNNGDTITQNIWFRDKNVYKKAKVTFNRDGVIEVSEENVASLDEISKAIEASETLGNPEEYLKILELQGRMDDVRKVRQQYEYYMNNKDIINVSKVPDEELKEMNEIADMLYDGSDEYIVGEDGRIINEMQEGWEVALDYEAKNEECIFWKGFTIHSYGIADGFGNIHLGDVEKIFKEIEIAAKQGQLVLTEAQRETLLKAKENSQPQEVSEQAFKVGDEDEFMISEPVIYQEDYLRYQDFITKGLDLSGYNLVYISGLERYNSFEEIFEHETSMKQLLDSATEPFTEIIYLRQGDEYKKATVTFDKTGVIGISEMEEVTSFDNILEGLNLADAIGNPEEHIRILLLQGNDEAAKQIQRNYENFLKNRSKIPEMLKHINEGMSPEFKAEFEDIMRRIADGEEISFGNVDIPEIEPDEGEIVYNGITISSRGNGLNQYGEIMMQIPDEVIDSIELAVEQGELVLTDAQRQTLLKAKQKPQDKEVSERDFKKVAENSIGEKDTAFNALKLASQELEKDSNIQSQGE